MQKRYFGNFSHSSNYACNCVCNKSFDQQRKENSSAFGNISFRDIQLNHHQIQQCQKETSFRKCKQKSKQANYKADLVSKEKQIVSLNSQIVMLNQTSQLLTEKIEILVSSNSALNQEVSKLHQRLKKQELQNQQLKRITRQQEKALNCYLDIMPKLNDLQLVQDRLVQENKLLERRNQKLLSLLKEVNF